jgi:hypothetical protein
MSLATRIAHGSVTGLVKLACVLALLALSLICYSVLVPRPLPVILAMSLGHVVGGSAFACYFLAVILDATRRPSSPSGHPASDGTVDARVRRDETPEVVTPCAEPPASKPIG